MPFFGIGMKTDLFRSCGHCRVFQICWIREKAREFQESIYFSYIGIAKVPGCVDHNKLWKILQEMRIQNHFTCLLMNLYTGEEATVRMHMEQWTGSELGKEYDICNPTYITSMQSILSKMPGWMKLKLELKILGKITSDMQMTPPVRQKAKKH